MEVFTSLGSMNTTTILSTYGGSDIAYLLQNPPAEFQTLQSHKWAVLFSLLAGSVVFSLSKYLLFHDRAPPGLKLIPGPRSTLPWLGRMHGIDAVAPWKSMKKWSDEYGGLFRLTTAGGEMHIWIGKAEIAQELYCKRAAKYSSRPEVPAVPGSDKQGQYLPLLQDDDHWRHQRKFGHTVLTECSGKEFYGYISHEAKRYVYNLTKDPKDHFTQCSHFCGRISARLAYGNPNSGAAHCKNAGEFIPQISPSASGPITNIFPFLGKLPEFINTTRIGVRQRREREERLWKGLMWQVKEDMANNIAPPSYARTYFEKANSVPQGLGFGMDEHEAAYAVGMLCTVAIMTNAGPMYCFFMAMVLHPEWQEKARAEIDAVVGPNRILEVSDTPNLPILRAVIKECIRWKPPDPLGVPRKVTADDEYNGYFIPKGAVVHAIDLAIAQDPELYPDPLTFNPGRWLEPEYPTYKEPLSIHPSLHGHHGFGRGRRLCLGIDLAQAELVVGCGSLLWAFEMLPTKDQQGNPIWPDPDHWTSNVIGGPLPLDIDIRVRSEQKRQMAQQLFEESLGDYPQ